MEAVDTLQNMRYVMGIFLPIIWFFVGVTFLVKKQKVIGICFSLGCVLTYLPTAFHPEYPTLVNVLIQTSLQVVGRVLLAIGLISLAMSLKGHRSVEA